MKSQKTYTQKIILTAFLVSAFFVFSNVASAITGSIDTSVENQVKVCKDNTCANPKPGIIYFKVSSDSPLVVDTEKGLSGKVWGDELGWVTFNPPYGGVFFADPVTGLLKGTAWSETSGAINFSVTGQKVIIDPKTGEWNGWAWASGPYGGWIKFDCKDATSCVHTIWNNEVKASTSPVPDIGKNEGQSLPTGQASFSKTFSSSFANLFDGTGQLISATFNSLFSSLTNTGTTILREIAKINGSAFTTSASNLKNLFNQMVAIKYEIVDIIGQKFSNTYNSMVVFLANIFTQNSLVNKIDGVVSPSPNEGKKEQSFVIPKEIGGKFDEVYDSIVSNLDKVQTPKVSPATEVEEVPVLTNTSPKLGLGENIKNVFREKNAIMIDNFNALVTSSADLFNQMTNVKYKIFDKAGDSYYTFSSNLINLRGSVLEGVNNLLK